MELLSIVLAGLLSLGSSLGLIGDKILEQNLRKKLERIEQLEVRIDNTPSYSLIQGKADKIRIAGRGLYILPAARIDILEVETDPVSIDLTSLSKKNFSFNQALRQPLNFAVRLELTEHDINYALRSPNIESQIQKYFQNLLNQFNPELGIYSLLGLNVDLLANNRLEVKLKLQKLSTPVESQPLNITIETGINLTSDYNIKLVNPTGAVNGKPISPRLLNGFAQGFNQRFDLRQINNNNTFVRVLQLEIEADRINLAAFMGLEITANQ